MSNVSVDPVYTPGTNVVVGSFSPPSVPPILPVTNVSEVVRYVPMPPIRRWNGATWVFLYKPRN